MSEQNQRMVSKWLLAICFVVAFLVVFGGFVRLTRSGLSIVEWNVISGVVPPIGESAWEAEFAKYQQTPEFQKVNFNMTLAEYKEIFLIEYVHRLIARLAGLTYALPALWFLFSGVIPWRKSRPFILIGLLFAFQGFMGWYMVSSGLFDRPHVSHIRLTVHLLIAIMILGLSYWTALDLSRGKAHWEKAPWRDGALRLTLGVLITLLLQISYGGLVAGLKAGYISNTFPLMFGSWIPQGLFALETSWLDDLIANPVTVHFVHRWFAFVVLGLATWLYLRLRRAGDDLARGAALLLGLVSLQVVLGVSVIWFSVPLWLALAHQANALGIFVAALFLIHNLRARRAA